MTAVTESSPPVTELPGDVAIALRIFLDSMQAQGREQDALNQLRAFIHEHSLHRDMPVDHVRWVPIEMVEPNDYNPNAVAQVEMGLLLRSIQHDGYTQPCVTIWDEARSKYVIVDGFHRYFVMRSNAALRERCHGRLPIVVLEKGINDRMASTVRHNRARGKHSVDGMASMVFSMLDNGMSDADICNELGMEPEELLRLKHITGFSKLFADTAYNRAWETKNQIEIRRRHAAACTPPAAGPTDTGPATGPGSTPL